MIDDLAALDRIHELLAESQANGIHPADDDGFTMTGALVIGMYVRPDGFAATYKWSYGQMHAYAQEGVLRTALRALERDEGDRGAE